MQMDDKEALLWQRHQSGDKTAREALVEHYLWLVPMVANQFRKRLFLAPQDAGGTAFQDDSPEYINQVHFGPLEQAGVLGLIEAIDKFDLSKGSNFSSYAYLFIKGEILASPEVTKNMPRRLGESIRKLRRIEDKFIAKHGYMPSDQEIEKLTGIKIQKIGEYRQATSLFNISSLDDFFNDADGDEQEIDIPDEFMSSPEESLIEKQDRILIQQLLKTLSGEFLEDQHLVEITRRAVKTLSERQQKVLLLTFMRGLTAEEIASEIGIAVGHVRVELSRAVKELREYFRKLNQDEVDNEYEQ